MFVTFFLQCFVFLPRENVEKQYCISIDFSCFHLQFVTLRNLYKYFHLNLFSHNGGPNVLFHRYKKLKCIMDKVVLCIVFWMLSLLIRIIASQGLLDDLSDGFADIQLNELSSTLAPSTTTTTTTTLTTSFDYVEDLTTYFDDLVTKSHNTKTNPLTSAIPKVSGVYANYIVSGAIGLCIVALLTFVVILFTTKNCKIFDRDPHPEFLLETSTDEETLSPLTPRRITRTRSHDGPYVPIQEEIELHNIRHEVKKENTVPIIKPDFVG